MPDRLHLSGHGRRWTLERHPDAVHVVEPDLAVAVKADPHGRWTADLGGASFRGSAVRHGDDVWVTIDGRVFHFTAGRPAETTTDAGALSVPMPATVVRIAVEPGQTVTRGDLIVALEAMKMELAIRAPRDAVVAAVHCRDGELVQPGRPLVELR